MKYLSLLAFLHISINVFGQDGTVGNPFTALNQAWGVTSSGVYYFDIVEGVFSTYVEADSGWILIASGSAATDESSYLVTSALSLQTDRILSSTIYAAELITAVRMNATSGDSLPFDVQTSHASVLTNLKNDRTLSYNTNYHLWTGTGTDRLNRGCAGNYNSLRWHIYHGCGIGSSMHWQVGQNVIHERVALSGSVKNDLNLWVRADPPLPVELLSFNVSLMEKNIVVLNWETASELNNDFFAIERSANALDWEEIGRVTGFGNSDNLLTYNFRDEKPFFGMNYYRLKQVDLDGHFDYTKIVSLQVEKPESALIFIYPNPFEHHVTIQADETELKELEIYNILGQPVLFLSKMVTISSSTISIDLSELNSGMYFIKTKNTATSIYKY